MKQGKNQDSSRKITRREFLQLSMATTSLLAGSSCLSQHSQTSKNPNILLIVTDQQHYETIAAGGCQYVKTPAMDRLMRRGVSFQNSYVANPVCGPARASIFTGRTCCETSVCDNGEGIRSGIPNLGQWIQRQSDYENIYIGKWHLPGYYQAEIEGFDTVYTGLTGLGYYGDTQKARVCEGYIRNHGNNKPFFITLSFMQPHDICEWLRLNTYPGESIRFPQIEEELPRIPHNFDFDENEPLLLKKLRSGCEPVIGNWSKEHWRFYRWSYYRQIEYMDNEIGRVLDALEESGLSSSTMIIFTSDHGEGMGHHQTVRKNTPYEESVRVPFLISLPGQIPQQRIENKTLVSGLDIVPTVCDYLNIPAPPKMQGISLKPILAAEKTADRDCIVIELLSNQARVIRSNKYKLIKFMNDPAEMLFDMQTDPGETKNLLADHRYESVLRQHQKWLSEWETNLDVADDVVHRGYWKNI